jgi:putative endopeptidase
VDWMSAETRVEALKKMEKFKVKIGFPDQWLDYSDLPVMRGEHFANVLSSRQYQHALELSRMNAPTDKGRWFMTPQTVNAYYHPSLNEIVFPAAILQAPFFDPNADAAVQYGSLGAVVGHEMTHGFDDQGRKYDSLGNLRDWWAEGDGPEYERRAAVMIRQAEQFEVHGNKLNGKLTCGENIADLGGVKLSLRALKKYLETETPSKSVANQPLINGFTPYQRLFLAWSQAWRENVKKERAIQLVTLDPHGPNELRCNGTLSNVQEFFEAFNIKEGSAMYKAVEDRVDIW